MQILNCIFQAVRRQLAVLCQKPQNQGIERFGALRDDGMDRRRSGRSGVVDPDSGTAAGKWMCAGDKLVAKSGVGRDVRLPFRITNFVQRASNTEIQDLDRLVGQHEDVARPDIPVNHVDGMRVLQALGHLQQDVDFVGQLQSCPGELAALQDGIESLPAQQFHDQVWHAILLAEIEDPDDVFVLQSDACPALVFQSPEQVRRRRQHLDGDILTEVRIVSPVDAANGAAVGFLVLNAISAKLSAHARRADIRPCLYCAQGRSRFRMIARFVLTTARRGPNVAGTLTFGEFA